MVPVRLELRMGPNGTAKIGEVVDILLEGQGFDTQALRVALLCDGGSDPISKLRALE